MPPLPLASVFADVPDPRRETKNEVHALADILTIATCGVIAWAESWDDIAEYGTAKEPFHRQYLPLANGVPGPDLFERVFAKRDPAAFATAFGRWMAALGLVGPVTLVLDNARYQRDDGVKGLAQDLGIEVPFLPAYSPSLNLIERVWRFTKRNAIYGKIHPTFADSRAAVQVVLDGVEATHADGLAPLMTLHFQEFEDVSLLAA